MNKLSKIFAYARRPVPPEAVDEEELCPEALKALQKRADEAMGNENWILIDGHAGEK